MKQFISTLLLLTALLQLSAQAPQSFKYQAVLRDAQGNPLTSKTVSLRISILSGSVTGNAVYVETHGAAGDAFGLVNLEIGKGQVVSGNFASIDWGAGSYFVKTELDASGGSSYTAVGTSQLLSVPYALYAESAGNGFSGNYNDLTGKPDQIGRAHV